MRFNPHNHTELTIEEICDPIYDITSKEIAKEYYKDYIKYIMTRYNLTFSCAANRAKLNIIYYINHFNILDVNRIVTLFNFDKNKIKILRNIKLDNIEKYV